MRISGSHRAERWEGTPALRTTPRRQTPAKVVALAQYDVRVRRELAHRRFVVSILRQILRLGTLHVLDAAAVAGAAVVAGRLTDIDIRAAIPALIVFVLAGLHIRRAYSAGDARRDPQRLVTGVLIGMVLAAIPATLQAAVTLPNQTIALFGLSSIALLIAERGIVDTIVHQAYAHRIGLRRMLIVARDEEVEHVLASVVSHQAGAPPVDDQEVLGHISPERQHESSALGSLGDLEQILEEFDVSEVLVATSLKPRPLSELAELCFERGVRVLVIPSAVHVPSGWAELTRVGRLPAYHLHPARLEFPALLLKRASDLLLASAMLILTAPLMLLIAACIRLESAGPVFFRQRRVGLGGREFNMWKFRSMLNEAEAIRSDVAHLNTYGDGRLFKLRSDPRITRVGRLLRRFSLDELPQLLNILAGDMSLVGPRPPLPSEVHAYEPRHLVRLSVVPGLTGPWQVNGRNLITDFEEVVRLERNYIENWSIRSDMEIILRTIAVVLSGKGAY